MAYDFFIGTVTNIIAAAVLDSKAPSLLDDCDKDKPKKDEGKIIYLFFLSCLREKKSLTKQKWLLELQWRMTFY